MARDRATTYANAIREGAPNAVQIADRWHLLSNLRAAVERSLARRYKQLKSLPRPPAPEDEPAGEAPVVTSTRRYAIYPRLEAQQAARYAERLARFERVKQLHAQGWYCTQIATAVGLARQTVGEWLRWQTLPPDRRGHRKQTKIDGFSTYLQERLAEGCTNQTQLWREIQAQGFTGTRSLVGKWVRRQQTAHGSARLSVPLKPLPTLRQLAWLLLRPDIELSHEDQAWLVVLQQEPTIVEIRDLAQQFATLVRQRSLDQWFMWRERCRSSQLAELREFAQRLDDDGEAFRAALTHKWSNGPTEGHINRLKLIKRQGYGRAGFDLLRARVLHRAAACT